MNLIVQKFGGSSVGTLERIRHVADRIIAAKQKGHALVVVVSAMYGETDRLIQLANSLTASPNPREFDVLISTGEQVSMALLSMALNAKACEARSFTGSQIGIHTDSVHTKARILNVHTAIIQKELAENRVVIIAGFQGINEMGHITTLGRGGSDTTAVAIAIALKAKECQIYTDVDGVYTTDPHVFSQAQLLNQISFEEMLEMASLGAKVLQMRCVELANKHNMPIRVLSTFTEAQGTLVTHEELIMQKRLVTGIAFSREEAMISLAGMPQQAGIEALILEEICSHHIEIDMIAQHVTADSTINFTFTVHRKEFNKTLEIMQNLVTRLRITEIKTNTKIAKVSLVGIGMRSHSGVANKMFKAIGNANIIIHMITTSEIRISVIINEQLLESAVSAIHEAFQLDKIEEKLESVSFE